MNNDNLTRDIQNKALEILEEFKKICKKYNLTYMAIGGTCLGAIRHHGFIPWDDDIDVVMPQDDYRRFLDIAKDVVGYPYSIITPKSCKHYMVSYAKMQDERTTFVERSAIKYKDRYSGVFIDIFPIYGLPKNETDRKTICRKYDFLGKINLKKRFPFSNENSLKGKTLWILTHFLSFSKPYYYFSEMQTRILLKTDFNSSDKIIFAWRATPKSEKGYKRIFYYDDFSGVKEVPFENSTINVPVGYDRYLKMDFGDYMELPPVEQRVSNHSLEIIDLHKSYKDYI